MRCHFELDDTNPLPPKFLIYFPWKKKRKMVKINNLKQLAESFDQAFLLQSIENQAVSTRKQSCAMDTLTMDYWNHCTDTKQLKWETWRQTRRRALLPFSFSFVNIHFCLKVLWVTPQSAGQHSENSSWPGKKSFTHQLPLPAEQSRRFNPQKSRGDVFIHEQFREKASLFFPSAIRTEQSLH